MKVNGDMPAHPVADVIDHERNFYQYGSEGLTKREAFAMAAMQGTLARRGPFDHAADAFDTLAYEAVRAADALLAALEPQA